MPVIEIIKERFCGLGDKHLAVAVWSEDDVLDRAKERHIKITREQAREIIDQIDRKQDDDLGISWTTINCYLDELK